MRGARPYRYDLSAASFARICTRLHLRVDTAQTHRSLRDAWREPQRHYHSTAHLVECLSLLQHWQEHAGCPDEIALALWYHDAVYDPQSSDNEMRSAEMAKHMLAASGASEYLHGQIRHLILATAHMSEQQLQSASNGIADADLNLLLDIDLAILGASISNYQRYRWQIRREYAWVEPAQYRAGRARVLQQFLQMPGIYRSSCAIHLESAARRNMQAELATLSTGS